MKLLIPFRRAGLIVHTGGYSTLLISSSSTPKYWLCYKSKSWSDNDLGRYRQDSESVEALPGLCSSNRREDIVNFTYYTLIVRNM